MVLYEDTSLVVDCILHDGVLFVMHDPLQADMFPEGIMVAVAEAGESCQLQMLL